MYDTVTNYSRRVVHMALVFSEQNGLVTFRPLGTGANIFVLCVWGAAVQPVKAERGERLLPPAGWIQEDRRGERAPEARRADGRAKKVHPDPMQRVSWEPCSPRRCSPCPPTPRGGLGRAPHSHSREELSASHSLGVCPQPCCSRGKAGSPTCAGAPAVGPQPHLVGLLMCPPWDPRAPPQAHTPEENPPPAPGDPTQNTLHR